MPQLLSVSDAQERLFQILAKKQPVTLPLSLANHLALAQDIFSSQDLPPFSNSSMDGFAVRSQDINRPPVRLALIEDIPAGHFPNKSIGPGQASRIMTGAPLPSGADAVVPLEETDLDSSRQPGASLPEYVTILNSCNAGQYVRPQGQDIHTGQELFRAGHQLNSPDLGLLASCGIGSVSVTPRPRIALFSSGDELASPGVSLAPGQIYDANLFTISSLLEDFGAEVIPLGVARDNPKEIDSILQHAVNVSPDIIVSTAGVSVGAYDFVRQRIETAGSLEFWKVNMRPGKPIAVGTYRSIPFVGLPGNPVSAFVGCLVFLVPAARILSGLPPLSRTILTGTLEEAVESDGRESYLRAIVTPREDGLAVRLSGHQGSANLFALTRSNALLIIPSGVKSLPAGDRAKVWLLKDPEN